MSKSNRRLIKDLWLFITLSLVYAAFLAVYSIAFPKGTLLLNLAAERTANWNQFFLLATRLGEEHIFLIAILIGLFLSYRKSAVFSMAGVFSLVVSYIAKSIFSQPRPYRYFSNLGTEDLMGHIDGYDFHFSLSSMPSGHTLAAFAFFVVLAALLKKKAWQLIAFIAAALTGISRIYLGQHFAADVAVGVLFGLGIGLLSLFIVYRIWEDREAMDRSFFRP